MDNNQHIEGSIDCLSRAVNRLGTLIDQGRFDPLIREELAIVRELVRDGRGALYGLQ